MSTNLENRHPSTAAIARYLLDDDGSQVSAGFAEFTRFLLREVSVDSPEFSVALRKVIEARDAVQRCAPRPDRTQQRAEADRAAALAAISRDEVVSMETYDREAFARDATRQDAVDLASELVQGGHTRLVKAALHVLGVERVDTLPDDSIPAFVRMLQRGRERYQRSAVH